MMSKLLIVFAMILVEHHYCQSHSLGERKWTGLLRQVVLNVAGDYESTRGFYGFPTLTKFNLQNRKTVFPSVNMTQFVLYGFGYGSLTRSSDFGVKEVGNGVTELSMSLSAILDLAGETHFETKEGSSVVNHTAHLHCHQSNYPGYASIPLIFHFNQNTNSIKVVKIDYKFEDTWNMVSTCNEQNIPGMTKEMCEDFDAVSTKYVLDGTKIKQHLTKLLTKIIESKKYEL